MAKCTHSDCFTCPYDDCVSNGLTSEERSDIKRRDNAMFNCVGSVPTARSKMKRRRDKTNRNYWSN